MSKTAQALVQNGEAIMDEIFNITRNTETTDPVRAEKLADYIVEKNLSLKHLVQDIIVRDRTGWKEVVGNITKITGYGYEDLGIKSQDIPKLEAFGFSKTRSGSSLWEALLKKKKVAVQTSQEKPSAQLTIA